MNSRADLCLRCQGKTKTIAQFSGDAAVVQCTVCELGFLTPQMPSIQVHDLYQNGTYYAEDGPGYIDYAGQEGTLRMTFKVLLKKLKRRRITGGSLLEIGCGFGYFLEESSKYFSEVHGTEMDPDVVRHLKNQGKIIENISLEDFSPERTWDVVAMIQVLEHMTNPNDAITRMQRLLKPSGTLLLVTPDFNSPLRYLMRSKWPSYKIPEHLYYFNKASLSSILRECGATSIQWLNYPHAFPLQLISEKIGIRLNQKISKAPIWIPKTSIAVLARFD